VVDSGSGLTNVAEWKDTEVEHFSGIKLTNKGGTPDIGDGTNRWGAIYGTSLDLSGAGTIGGALTCKATGGEGGELQLESPSSNNYTFDVSNNTTIRLFSNEATDTDFSLFNIGSGEMNVGITGDLSATGITSGGTNIQSGSFAGIHVHDASTAQSIATGATYTKSTAFTDNDASNDCTADATNDKITITRTGIYRVASQVSFSSGTANVVFECAAFLNGVEQDQAHWQLKVSSSGDVGSAGFTGIIDVTTAPWDLDLRFAHDNGGAVNATVTYAQLNVQRLGDT